MYRSVMYNNNYNYNSTYYSFPDILYSCMLIPIFTMFNSAYLNIYIRCQVKLTVHASCKLAFIHMVISEACSSNNEDYYTDQ